MSISNDNIFPYLPEVYWHLFLAIKKQRPSLENELEKVIGYVENWDYEKFDEMSSLGALHMESTFNYIENALKLHVKNECPDLFYNILMCDLFKKIYTHANYWYVLIDGIVLESIFEKKGEEFLKKIEEATGVNYIDLLQNVVEPLTVFNYTVISKEREDDAKKRKEIIIKENVSSLSDEFENFILFYSRVKCWHVKWKEISKNTLQKYIPTIREEILDIANDLKLELTENDTMPWNLLEIIDEKIIPAIFIKYTYAQ